jgi:hypothetical protein
VCFDLIKFFKLLKQKGLFLFQGEGGTGTGVEAYDYTPYFYFVMAVIVAAHVQFTLLAKPNLKRSEADAHQIHALSNI